MANLRAKGKSTIVWILMGLMVLGLGGFGVTSFSGGSTAVGQVGETRVTADEYARALRGEMMAITRQTGRPLSMVEAQAMGLPQAVQANLFTAAALAEQARVMGVSVGDERVAQTILAADAFRGPNGRFDRTAYAEVLRRERLTEAEFEAAIRTDEARLLLQRAVAGGVAAPAPMVDQTTRWVLETRDFSWRELTEADLPAPITEPDEATLEAWHAANADRFTRPEIRVISYAWVTPQMLAAEVELDEAALRATYDQNIAEFQQPERRLLSRLIFGSQEQAAEAAAAIEAGDQPFEAFVLQRGLTLDDVDLGAVTQAELGAVGAEVFAAPGNQVVGPLQTDLGWALFSVNAILDPVDVPFEEAREGLRAEAALSRAARLIQDRVLEFEDLLAGGATIEHLAAETEMQAGRIEWHPGLEASEDSIAAYADFRERAETITERDFPELFELVDGGVYTMRLDEVIPPALIPFAEARAEVLADWRQAELQRQLLELAENLQVAALADAVVEPMRALQPAPETPATLPADSAAEATGETAELPAEAPADPWTSETQMVRNSWLPNLPQAALLEAFAIDEPGEVEIVDAGDRVILVRLDAVGDADLSSTDALAVQDRVAARIGQSLQDDIFDYYARYVQRQHRIEVNQAAINAINTQVQ